VGNLGEKAFEFVEVPRRCDRVRRALLTISPYRDGKAGPLCGAAFRAAVATTNFKDRTCVCSVAEIGINPIEQARQEGLSETVMIRREWILQHD
jgi:hypothetical protein